MRHLQRTWFFPFLLLLALFGTAAQAADEDDLWAPTPPRLSYIDGKVSYWRPGAEEWADVRLNLALSEGDELYTGKGANLEVQFDSRSFARADENTLLSLVNQDEHYIQFKVASGLVSFDIRSIAVGDTVEVDTPDAVFTIEHPGYYRVDVGGQRTHFITRRGGRAIVTTADGRSLSIYPSEDIVITAGNPVQVATYAAPDPDAWDRWNDARSDRIGESVSSRYLPPDMYGAEELDHYGYWRVVPDYGPVWIPRGIGPDWVPYSTGTWVWDPYYEWTWIDDAPWGWAPFHYGRWVYIGSYWAWCPGPVVRRSIYYPALVAFLIHDHDVSVRVGIGLPGLWWVALSWGEPVLPWWGDHRHRWHPRWDGWGGPRIVNNVVIKQTTVINVGDIRYRNAQVPRAILTVPEDRFGRAHIRATEETRYRHDEFVPLRGDMPVKPTRASLYGGASKAAPPPREVMDRPVVATRPPRERALPWQEETARARPQIVPESRYVKTPSPREEERVTLPRPPFGSEGGPERTPPPLPPRLEEMPAPAPATPSPRVQSTTRRQETISKEAPAAARPAQQPAISAPPQAPVSRPAPAPQRESVQRAPGKEAPAAARPAQQPAISAPPQAPVSRPAPTPQRESVQRAPGRAVPPSGEIRQERKVQPLPGTPANETYRGQGQKARSWEQRSGR
jgi:hypothetical protein